MEGLLNKTWNALKITAFLAAFAWVSNGDYHLDKEREASALKHDYVVVY